MAEKAHKYRIYPNKKQKELIQKTLMYEICIQLLS